MRKQTYSDLRDIRNQEDLLRGNINRMCVTDSLSELDTMAHHAIERIKIIQNINYKRLTEKEQNDGET